jgi:hypothetical protein
MAATFASGAGGSDLESAIRLSLWPQVASLLQMAKVELAWLHLWLGHAFQSRGGNMKRKLSTIGLFSSLSFATACASGGAAATSEVRSEARLGEAVNDNVPPRWSCTPSNTAAAPSNGLIADFSPKNAAGDATSGGIPRAVYTVVPPESVASASMTQTTDAGKLTIDIKAAPRAQPQFLTATVPFDGCIDATGFAGVQFRIGGSLSGCSLTFASIDPEHQFYRAGGPYPPQQRVFAEDLTSAPQTINAPFARPDIQGNPATPVNPGKLAAIQWLVIVPVAPEDGSSATLCTGKIVIDGVKLYR